MFDLRGIFLCICLNLTWSYYLLLHTHEMMHSHNLINRQHIINTSYSIYSRCFPRIYALHCMHAFFLSLCIWNQQQTPLIYFLIDSAAATKATGNPATRQLSLLINILPFQWAYRVHNKHGFNTSIPCVSAISSKATHRTNRIWCELKFENYRTIANYRIAHLCACFSYILNFLQTKPSNVLWRVGREMHSLQYHQ